MRCMFCYQSSIINTKSTILYFLHVTFHTFFNSNIIQKCHTLWNQYLFFKKKPHTLQFHFVYHGLENYLKKCDDYKPEQHKKIINNLYRMDVTKQNQWT